MLGRPLRRVNSTRSNSRPRKIQCATARLAMHPATPGAPGDQEIVFNYGLGLEPAPLLPSAFGGAGRWGDQKSRPPPAKSCAAGAPSGVIAASCLSVHAEAARALV